jgi:hypothetical protein
MENELKDLSDTLLELYLKNLEFLRDNFEEVFKKVDVLSNEISNEKYSCKYSLEYIDGYFDILNLENNSFFYHTNSYDDADFRSNHTNFTKDGSLDLLRKGVDGKRLIGSESFRDVMPVVDYINENVDFDNIEFQKIYKFVFIGCGLGFHIHEITKKIDPFTTFIIEPELEIFRLSLFTIDYSEFEKGNKKLFLSVGDNMIGRKEELEKFNMYHNYMNYNIKHHMLIENYDYIKQEIIDFFSTNTVASFPYALTITNIHRTMDFLRNNERFLSIDDSTEKKILKDKKVLVVSAGPSLDKYIDWIEEHQDKFIIICVDVILRKLEKNNIVPDIVFSIDPSYLCAGYLTCENEKYLENSAVVMLSQQDESVLKVVKDLKYYFAQSIVLIPELGFFGSVSNVGTYSLMMAIHFGANEIYTIGNDAAFDQETGSRYASDSSCPQSEKMDIDNIEENIVSSYDILEVEGNLREKVKSNRSLLAFKDSFEAMISGMKKHYQFKLFNLSDGVKIEGFSSITKDEMNEVVRSSDSKVYNIQQLLDGISKIVEVPDSKKDIKVLNSITSRIKKHKNIKIKDRDDFLEKKLDVMMWLLNQSKEMHSILFGNIFLQYTELADTYINFVLNLRQKELSDKDHLKKLNMIWSDGVLAVIKDIKTALK